MNQVRNAEHLEFLLPEGWARPSGYSQGIAARGRVLFVAGQVGWNPRTMQFETDDFMAQVHQTLQNIVSVLRQGGAGPEHLVRLTWFVTSAKEYTSSRPKLAALYADIIGRHYPPMSILVVSELLEPRALVEIEATAVVPD